MKIFRDHLPPPYLGTLIMIEIFNLNGILAQNYEIKITQKISRYIINLKFQYTFTGPRFSYQNYL
jgi:hypothetical protein